MDLANFNFDLPTELIAQSPLSKRSASRLLSLDKTSGKIAHHTFKELPNLLASNDLLIFNNTKVIPARLFTNKPTGGKVELLIERLLPNEKLLVQAKTSKSLKIGTKLILTDDSSFEVVARHDNFFELALNSTHSLNTVLERFGQTPLPPYIKHQPTTDDKNRYQTIYAQHEGAVAAPTAGLHFDEELMQNLNAKKINTAFLTLHVGAGTFQPIRTLNIEDHKMHHEYIDVPQEICEQIITTKKKGGRVIAVGTTSARALEATSQAGEIKPFRGDTNIFIYPGYQFRCIDGLITNFHLPKTSLLLLICAFAGHKNTMHAYQEAIQQRYRFFSYGDGMLIV